MTVRDVAVQVGFVMVTAGTMLLVWAVLTGQFGRGPVEDVTPEPRTEPEPAKPARRAPATPKQQVKKASRRSSAPAAQRSAAKRKPAPRKRAPRA